MAPLQRKHPNGPNVVWVPPASQRGEPVPRKWGISRWQGALGEIFSDQGKADVRGEYSIRGPWRLREDALGGYAQQKGWMLCRHACLLGKLGGFAPFDESEKE